MALSAVSGSDRVRVPLWALLGAGLSWAAFRWPESGSFWICVLFSLFSFLTSLSIGLRWRVGRWLGFLGGIVLILYALALILLGTEDVGGLGVSLPWGSVLLAFGAWNLVGGPHRQSRAA